MRRPISSTSLGYSPTDVTLNLTLGLGKVAGLNANQASVGATIDSAFNTGGGLTGNFLSLLALPPAALPGALSQLSGETATAIAPAGLEAQNRFLMLMLDPFAGVGETAGATSMRATSFAAGRRAERRPDARLCGQAARRRSACRSRRRRLRPPARAGAGRRGPRPTAARAGRAGDAAIGSHDRDVRTGNIASGFDYHFSPDITVGVALSGGTASFGLSDNLGSGHGDIYQVGAYGALRRDSFYLAASLAVSRYEISQSRTVAFPGALSALSSNTAAHGHRRAVRGRQALRLCRLRHHALSWRCRRSRSARLRSTTWPMRARRRSR